MGVGVKPCDCQAMDPTHGKPYPIAHAIATNLNKQGLRQVKCPHCHLFTVWTDKKTT